MSLHSIIPWLKAKALGINPHSYMTHVFDNAGGCRTDENWDALFPGRADLSNVDDYFT